MEHERVSKLCCCIEGDAHCVIAAAVAVAAVVVVAVVDSNSELSFWLDWISLEDARRLMICQRNAVVGVAAAADVVVVFCWNC